MEQHNTRKAGSSAGLALLPLYEKPKGAPRGRHVRRDSKISDNLERQLQMDANIPPRDEDLEFGNTAVGDSSASMPDEAAAADTPEPAQATQQGDLQQEGAAAESLSSLDTQAQPRLTPIAAAGAQSPLRSPASSEADVPPLMSSSSSSAAASPAATPSRTGDARDRGDGVEKHKIITKM